MTLKWLVIGIGDITRKRVIPGILEDPRSELAAIFTRDPGKAAAYPGARVYQRLDEALGDPSVDAVYVASPVALHGPQSIAALAAGKHVLCEKPMAMDYGQAQTMVEAARNSGRLFGVAYYRRLYPKVLRARQLMAEGAIGRVVLAEANCQNWIPAAERGWLWDPELAGGGPLYDTASHRIDMFNFLFGRPVRATGLLSNVVHQLGVEDSATLLIDYENDVRGVVDCRWNSHIYRDQCRVIGTDGEINLDPLGGAPLRVNGVEESLPPHDNFHYPAIENFAAAVLGGTPVMCTGDEALWTDWVTEQVMQQAGRRA